MIRLIVRFATWLNARFPEKLEVSRAAYEEMLGRIGRQDVELSLLTDRVAEFEKSHAATIDRVGRLESSAVHKGAVQDLVGVVKALKDEQIALKANLGWQKPFKANSELNAMLNGEVITDGE